jgi:hypothetical protein
LLACNNPPSAPLPEKRADGRVSSALSGDQTTWLTLAHYLPSPASYLPLGLRCCSLEFSENYKWVERGERVWLPLADWLLVAATLPSLLCVIVPLVIFSGDRFPAAASGAAAILVAGYVLAVLASPVFLWANG